ncbi:MAG TPA: hypothetical protein VLI90_12285 [Tepidisphaeraceae bacterium]|nr:hypothetical protein [Tepidisphaeraceae bacterium]
MSWEAFRLTSKSPGELLHTLGPHGVDDLMRQALNAVWRDYPPEQRSYGAVRAAAGEVFNRNMRVWSAIKKPTPEAFFVDLQPQQADGFMRQAFVLCWMMLPRTGGRDFKSTHAILRAMFQRNMDAWEQDNQTFTGGGGGKKRAKAKKATQPVKKKAAKKVAKKTKRR